MNKLLTFSFIGGDLRQKEVISQLAEDGFHIKVFGFSDIERKGNIYPCKTVVECVRDADVIVLPLPVMVRGKINAPFSQTEIDVNEVIENAESNAVIFGGKIPDEIKNADFKVFDYSEREEMAILNAIPTAEGAISIAMENTPYTLFGSKCLVIGYGKIGKVLSADLKSLGADVTATARKYSDLAWVKANGYKGVKTSKIVTVADEFDIIFNTVPHMVLDFKVLSKTKRDVLIIDLASRPGGVDFQVAKELNRHTIQALSLPGKVAFKTAGGIIKNTLVNILEELGV